MFEYDWLLESFLHVVHREHLPTLGRQVLAINVVWRMSIDSARWLQFVQVRELLAIVDAGPFAPNVWSQDLLGELFKFASRVEFCVHEVLLAA